MGKKEDEEGQCSFKYGRALIGRYGEALNRLQIDNLHLFKSTFILIYIYSNQSCGVVSKKARCQVEAQQIRKF